LHFRVFGNKMSNDCVSMGGKTGIFWDKWEYSGNKRII